MQVDQTIYNLIIGVISVIIKMSHVGMFPCMSIAHKGHNNAIQVYSVTIMIHVRALEARQSNQGTSEPIFTPIWMICKRSTSLCMFFHLLVPLK